VGIAEDLADELADLGIIGAVRALLQAELRRSDRVGALQRLRDAALDLGDLALALTAQHHLANLKHLDALEWRCLGDMLATVGSSEAAEAAFIRADKLAPGDPLLAARLTALRSDDFGDFTVRSGFATPEPRKQLRFARRQA
jgi:tetratricopeptide (TPR) repeat protein